MLSLYTSPGFPDPRYFDLSPALISLSKRQAEKSDTLTLCEAWHHLRTLPTRRNRAVMLAVLDELEKRDPEAYRAWVADVGPHLPSPVPYFSA